MDEKKKQDHTNQFEQYQHYNEEEPLSTPSAPDKKQRVSQAHPDPVPPVKPPTPPHGKKKKRIIIACVTAVVAILAAVAIAVASTANRILNKLDFQEQDSTNIYVAPNTLQSLPDVYNILLLGIDKMNEGEDYPRSDTMILVSLDKINKKIKLTSFMRDIYLYIPGYEKEKMNAACKEGGPQLVMDTIEYHFGVDVNAYVMVDFDSFVSIIDQLDGLDIELSASEANFIKNNISPDVHVGMNTLNGDLALVYSRIRKLDSDFQRTGRQRKVINALIEKAKGASLLKLVNIAEELAPQVQTSLSKSDLSFLARNATSYLNYEIEELRLPTDNGYKDIELPYPIGQALEMNMTEAKILVQNFIYPQNAESAGSTAPAVTSAAN